MPIPNNRGHQISRVPAPNIPSLPPPTAAAANKFSRNCCGGVRAISPNGMKELPICRRRWRSKLLNDPTANRSPIFALSAATIKGDDVLKRISSGATFEAH